MPNPKPLASIHAKCGKFRREDKRTLICSKSKGHVSPQCYDSDRDIYFFPDN